MPGVAELPARPELPDVMTFENGEKVTSAAQWKKRREEMRRILACYATGLMPPSPGNVRGRDVKSALVLGGSVRYRLVHLSFGPGSTYGFDLAVFVPAGATGRVATVIFPTFGPTPGGTPLTTMVRPPEQGKGLDALTIPLGDQTARAAEAAAATPAPPAPTPLPMPRPPASDPETTAAAHAELFRRGYALVMYHYQDTGEDTIGRNTDGSWAFRSTRYYPAHPDYDWGLAAGWAWGISRCIDYLETQAFADRGKFIAVGHSRIGKAVLVAGAFEERLTVVAPAGSGAGGTGAYRFNGERGGGREGLSDMMRKYPNWFSPNLYQFAAQVDQLPFDPHTTRGTRSGQQYLQPPAWLDVTKSETAHCAPHRIVLIPGAFAQRDLGTACADDDVQCALCHASHRSIGLPPTRISSNCRRTWWPRSSTVNSGPVQDRRRATPWPRRGLADGSNRPSTKVVVAQADG